MSGFPAVAGDINGDGYDDFLIGAPDNDAGGTGSGQVYVLFGKETGWQLDLVLDQADASIVGPAGWEIGAMPEGAGDVNADGFDDFVFWGSPGIAAEVYLVLGRDTGWQMDMSLGAVDAAIGGDANDYWLNFPMGGADLNGDGFDDFMITSESNCDGGNGAGKVFLFLGRASGWDLVTELDSADASYIGEEAFDDAGTSTAMGGDVDGDGHDDALIGADGNDEAAYLAGKAYVLFGGAGG